MKVQKQQISAFFLLGVFLLMLFNSVVPHTHHTHTADSLAFTEHNHNHTHEYHHTNTQQQIESEHSYAQVSEHSHSSHIHELSPATSTNKAQKVQKSVSKILVLSNVFRFNKSFIAKQKNYISYEESPHKNLYIKSTSLRGPPFLV